MTVNDLAKKLLPLPLWVRIAYFRQYWLLGEWEMRELAGLLPRRGLAIDVGANIGLYSYSLKRLGQQVIAFEPDPAFQTRLLALLGKRAHIETVALSSEQGTGTMRVPVVADEYGGALGSLSDQAVPDEMVSTSYGVELRTLDSYNFTDVAFVKIDVEGHEEAVLAGAAETLERSKPVLLIEIEERHNPGGLDRIAKSLSKLGYQGSFFHQRKRRGLSEFVPDVHQAESAIARGDGNRRKLDYVNNFVFTVP